MRIVVVGTGYVGLVSGAGLADFGNEVLCVDLDRSKIDLLERGEIPFYEPGLKDLVARNVRETGGDADLRHLSVDPIGPRQLAEQRLNSGFRRVHVRREHCQCKLVAVEAPALRERARGGIPQGRFARCDGRRGR